MRMPQLPCLLLACGLVATGCNRAEREANADLTKEQVKAVAARASEQLADSWLTTKIQAQYFADENVKVRHINVSTRDGVVTLTGFVDSAAERQEALEIARNTDGVKTLNDRLTQTAGSPDTRAVATSGATEVAASPAAAVPSVDDAQVTARVQSKFFVDERVKERRIGVDTRNGIVTLSGEVASEDERGQALLLARTTEGVERVEDHLTVNVGNVANSAQGTPNPAAPPPRDDATLATTIQAKFFVDPEVKANVVEVSVKDGVVLLQGTVTGAPAHQQALAIARSTEGVVQVVDRLTVAKKGR